MVTTGSTEGHCYNFTKPADWLYLVSRAKVSEEIATKILDTLADLDAICPELYANKMIWSDNYIERLIPVYEKRSTDIPSKPSIRGENPSNRVDKRQSKVKESKGEKQQKEKPVQPVRVKCPHQDIITMYHKCLPMLPQIRDWNDNRQRLLRARWNEDTERQNLDWWRKFFKDVSSSAFLTGRTDNPFQCHLEWLIKPTNFSKTIEGHYNNRKGQGEEDDIDWSLPPGVDNE